MNVWPCLSFYFLQVTVGNVPKLKCRIFFHHPNSPRRVPGPASIRPVVPTALLYIDTCMEVSLRLVGWLVGPKRNGSTHYGGSVMNRAAVGCKLNKIQQNI
uniref:Putative secreted protein n=1 Tax=Rhipicephalus microplus TaxID=6941 RepID=A0A6M2D9U1_RHIMP